MKIVFMAPYIYDNKHTEFKRNPTGFGYMVKDILEEISKRHDTTLITHVPTEGYIENYTVPRHKIIDILKNISFFDFLQGIYYAVRFQQDISLRLRYLYYFIDKGYVRHQLCKIKPDIVHIHGVTYQTKPYIDLCKEMKIPFIITLHGLNGVSNINLAMKHERKYEYDLLKACDDKNVRVTVVSSGCKDKIKNIYHLSTKNISVVLNGTNITNSNLNYQNKRKAKYKQYYNILVVGNICHHKNQLEIIEALNFLPQKWGDKVQVYFCGGNAGFLPINKKIANSHYKNNLHYLGFVSREKMDSLWENADLNIVASLEEGFGLSIIEGFAYGVPTLTFSDLEAVKDLYHEKTMMLMNKRDDLKYFSEKIMEALNTNWDHEFIKEYAYNFSIKKTADDYETEYRIAMKGNKNEVSN